MGTKADLWKFCGNSNWSLL